jgi:hypothetical protein
MTGPTRRREAGYVAEFELDDPLDGVGTVLWRVGMVSVKERWHELVAAHVVKEDASRTELEEAEEAFALDVVANTCVWEEHGDQPRVYLEPGDVTGWVDDLDWQTWIHLVEECFRVSGPSGWEWAQERLRRSDLLQVEMAVAAAYGIRHSELMGWPEEDRALAIAHLVDDRARCTGCGVPRRAMKDPDAAVLDADGCFWCGVLSQARKDANVEQNPRIRLKRGY